ncbi:hypothetical protein, partial [Nocardia cerradoensis]|uniref:hypothetical protein n=1 Tax=Nocardia cerradoensis TaxID=85688 RepID=UPI001CB8C513
FVAAQANSSKPEFGVDGCLGRPQMGGMNYENSHAGEPGSPEPGSPCLRKQVSRGRGRAGMDIAAAF